MQGWNPSLSSFNSKFHLPYTEVSVQGAPVSLASWDGIPVSLILIVSNNYDRLKIQSRELLFPLFAGLESQFIPVYLILIVSNNYYRLKYLSRELLSSLLAGLESQFI